MRQEQEEKAETDEEDTGRGGMDGSFLRWRKCRSPAGSRNERDLAITRRSRGSVEYVSVSLHVSVRLSVFVSVYLSVCPSFYPSVCM